MTKIKPRKAVRWFARRMEERLKANDDKPGWLDDRLENLLICANGKLFELYTAVQCGNFSLIARYLQRSLNEFYAASLDLNRVLRQPNVGIDYCDAIINEAADLGNFAMMIGDVAREKRRLVIQEQKTRKHIQKIANEE